MELMFFPLWHSKKLLFSHYGIICNSCFFPLYHKTHIYSQCAPIFWGYRFFLSSKHSEFPDFIVNQVVEFFCRRYIIFFHIFVFLSDMLRTSLQVHFLQCMKNQKEDNGLQVFHNLLHTVFQCMVCLESYKIWVFENMQTILGSILWPVYDIHVCHTLAWTVYDIHATIYHHLWLGIYLLFFSTRVWVKKTFSWILKNSQPNFCAGAKTEEETTEVILNATRVQRCLLWHASQDLISSRNAARWHHFSARRQRRFQTFCYTDSQRKWGNERDALLYNSSLECERR